MSFTSNVAFGWYGGKSVLAPVIVRLIPKHQTYVEVFGGSGAVLLAKSPSPVEIFNDIDQGLINFFRVLRDPTKWDRFYRMVGLTPYSRREYLDAQATWTNEPDDIKRAASWFLIARGCFSGKFSNQFSYSITTTNQGRADRVEKWLAAVDRLPSIASRLLDVLMECLDFRDLIPRYDTPNTIFYLDPPYMHGTRIEPSAYDYEMSDEDHVQLVQLLLKIQGMGILSGYQHETYTPLETAGWTRQDIKVLCYANLASGAGTRKERIESLWLSPGLLQMIPRQLSMFDIMSEPLIPTEITIDDEDNI
jgi:DNA adenine methylase